MLRYWARGSRWGEEWRERLMGLPLPLLFPEGAEGGSATVTAGPNSSSWWPHVHPTTTAFPSPSAAWAAASPFVTCLLVFAPRIDECAHTALTSVRPPNVRRRETSTAAAKGRREPAMRASRWDFERERRRDAVNSSRTWSGVRAREGG